MTDNISRADAIEEISKGVWNVHELIDRVNALPSAEQVTSKLKNPCDSLLTEESNGSKEHKSKLESADAVQGEWIMHGEPPWYVRECSKCGTKWHQWSGDSNPNYCGHCGARMKGGDDE